MARTRNVHADLAGGGRDSTAGGVPPSASTPSVRRKLRPVEEHPAQAYRPAMPRLPINLTPNTVLSLKTFGEAVQIRE